MAESYGLAQIRAERETGLPLETFPQPCPYAFDQAIDDNYWPD